MTEPGSDSPSPARGLLARLLEVDHRFMDAVTAPQGVLRKALFAVTFLGSPFVTVPVELLGWLLATPPLNAWFGLCLVADVPGHIVFIAPLRFLTKRERPTPVKPGRILFAGYNRWSFPSAHSLRTCTLATILSAGLPGWWPFLAAAAAVITLTRIPLRRHYPFDILVGCALGIVWGTIMTALLPGGIALP